MPSMYLKYKAYAKYARYRQVWGNEKTFEGVNAPCVDEQANCLRCCDRGAIGIHYAWCLVQ